MKTYITILLNLVVLLMFLYAKCILGLDVSNFLSIIPMLTVTFLMITNYDNKK